MTRLITTVLAAYLLGMSTCVALPALIWGFDTITGEIVSVADTRKEMFGSGGIVIHLRKTAGVDQKVAKEMFREIRRSGYKPKRITLRADEVVLILDPKERAHLKIGMRVRISKYSLMKAEKGIVRAGECRSIENL